MENLKINHVGYLVKNMNESLDIFFSMGFTLVSKFLDNLRNIQISFIEKNGYIIELIQPINDSSIVTKLINKIGPSPYHICYETFNIDLAIAEFKNKGWIVVVKKQPAIAFNYLDVVFLYNKNIGLIELLGVKS
jgi:methylmalonyl-CoA/ethylmalonyl-CoA epimerase